MWMLSVKKLNDDIHCHVVTVSLHDQNHTNSKAYNYSFTTYFFSDEVLLNNHHLIMAAINVL